MDNMGRQLIWNRIREKIEKGEQIDPGDIIWGILLNGGLSTKESFLGDDKVKSLESDIKRQKDIKSKKEGELKALYEEKKGEHNKDLTESKEFFKKFQSRCKEIKSEITKSKIGSDIKDAAISLMTDYLEMLNREIIALDKFPDYEEWKKDILSVSSNQVEYLKKMVRRASKIRMNNIKTWGKIEKDFPIPEHLRGKT